jgi:hypothetical protein
MRGELKGIIACTPHPVSGSSLRYLIYELSSSIPIDLIPTFKLRLMDLTYPPAHRYDEQHQHRHWL